MALAGMKKGAEAPFFNDLQTPVEVCGSKFGAGDESRTRDLNLGKVALYQLSYSRRALHLTEKQTIAQLLLNAQLYAAISRYVPLILLLSFASSAARTRLLQRTIRLVNNFLQQISLLCPSPADNLAALANLRPGELHVIEHRPQREHGCQVDHPAAKQRCVHTEQSVVE